MKYIVLMANSHYDKYLMGTKVDTKFPRPDLNASCRLYDEDTYRLVRAIWKEDVLAIWKVKSKSVDWLNTWESKSNEKREFIHVDTSTSSTMNNPSKFEKWIYGMWARLLKISK